MEETAIRFEGDDVNEITDPITPNMRGIDGCNPMDETIKEALKSGVTTVAAGPGSANVIGGTFFAYKTAGNCIDEMTIQNPLAMKAAFGENPKRCYQGKKIDTRMQISALLRETLAKTKEYIFKKESGKDVDYDQKLEAMIPVIKKEMPLKCHCHIPAGNAGAIRSRPGTCSRSGRTARSVQTRAPARAEAADLGNLPFGTARLGGQQSGRGAFRAGNGRTGGRDDRPRVRTETGTRPGKDPEPHPGTTSAVRPGLRTDEGAGQHDLAERADERTARRDTPQQDRDADAHRRTGGHHGSDRTGSGRQRGNSGRTPDQTRRPGEIHDGKESADRGTPQSIGFGSGVTRLKSGIYGRWSVRRKQIPNCASTEKQSEN